MFAKTHPVSEQEVRDLLTGRLSARRAELVRRRIREDPQGLELYERLVRAERALEGSTHGEPDGLGFGATERVQSRLFASLDTELKRGAGLSRSVAPWAVLASGVGLAAALVVVGEGPWTSSSGEYRARSGESATVDANHYFQVLRVGFDDAGVISVGPAREVWGGDALRFAAFTRTRPAELSVIAEMKDDSRAILAERIPLEPQAMAERLELAWKVPESAAGEVRLAAVFEHDGTVDLQNVDLQVRDTPQLSVRAVTLAVEETSP